MSFNQKSVGTKTTNLAGGVAYSESPELELVSILLTSFGQDQAYRTAGETFDKLKSLIFECDKKFVAQAAVYARNKYGMRSITHVVASELAKYIGGEQWAKDFYNAIIYRPDDMMEILSYHFAGGNKVSGAMKKGFAKAFDKFNAYSLAKYRKSDKQVKLIDVVNLVRPVPVEKNKEALSALVKNELRAFDTWETELSATGGNEELKKDVWVKLINEKKIGYFALLRNLRNILAQSPEIIPAACEMLINEEAIKKSLVLPFRFTTAFEEIQKLPASQEVRSVMIALSKSVDISLSNVPKFAGQTLVVLDVSGSMAGKPAQIGSLFAAVLIKACNADMMVFAERAQYLNVNPMDSTMTIANALRFGGGGTNFHSIFQTANKKYDRVIILSDMQGWIGGYSPAQDYNTYKIAYKASPFVYSFDLAGLGTLQLPERNVFCLAGFSDKTLALMSMLEEDKNALVNEIKTVDFNRQ